VRLNPYEVDPRTSRPSIKTSDSIRQIPVSEHTARLIQEYVANYRGKPNHSFLLNSQKNKPLSTEMITATFRTINSHLPCDTLRSLENHLNDPVITPHAFRHTCAVVRLNQLLSSGVLMDEALQQMRSFFGWSRSSQEPLRYARAVFEDRLGTVWRAEFDERVEILRALERV
jgi:integrase